MLKNERKKQSQDSKSSASCTLTELLAPDHGRRNGSLSGRTDTPPPPPPTVSNSNVKDPSSVNNIRPGAPPAAAGKKGDAQETKEEMFHSSYDCGEPMRPQHLVLDFSPIEGVDDDAYNVKKVLDFWKFIRSIPGLDNLRASPTEDWDESENGEDITREESEHDGPEKPGTVDDATSAIPWMKHDEMVSTAFASRQRGKYCEHGAGDHVVPHPHKTIKKSAAKPRTSLSSFGQGRGQGSEGSGHPTSSQASAPEVDVHTLCKQLDEWDHFHPSTLEPPAPPPKRGYNTAVLQRLSKPTV